MSQTYAEQIEVCWTPSHIEYAKCSTTEEEYLATWNDVVDQQAVNANLQRGPDFQAQLQRTEAFYKLWMARLRALRSFYLQVATKTADTPEIIDLVDASDQLLQRIHNEPLGEVLSVSWRSQLRWHEASMVQPVSFILNLFDHCIDAEPLQPNLVAISFVEITLWLVHFLNAQFPVETTATGHWVFKSPNDMLLRPTIAFWTQKVRQSFREGLQLLGLQDYLCRGLNRQVSGIVVPIDGVLLSLPAETYSEICHLTHSIFPRQLRKAADTAKPC